MMQELSELSAEIVGQRQPLPDIQNLMEIGLKLPIKDLLAAPEAMQKVYEQFGIRPDILINANDGCQRVIMAIAKPGLHLAVARGLVLAAMDGDGECRGLIAFPNERFLVIGRTTDRWIDGSRGPTVGGYMMSCFPKGLPADLQEMMKKLAAEHPEARPEHYVFPEE